MKKSILPRAPKTPMVKLGKVLHVLATAIRRSEARRATQTSPDAGSRMAAVQRLAPRRRGAT